MAPWLANTQAKEAALHYSKQNELNRCKTSLWRPYCDLKFEYSNDQKVMLP